MQVEHYKAGEEIVWCDKNVCALNNRSGIFEHSTAVAEGKFIRVCLVNSFNGTADNVPENATAYAQRKARRRDYTLISGDKVVGWATIHNDHTNEETEDNTDTEGNEPSTDGSEGAGADTTAGAGASATESAEGAGDTEDNEPSEETDTDGIAVLIKII